MMLVTAILAVVLGLAGWLVYARTTGALDAELRSRIREDFALMQDAHARAGEQGLEQFISWAMATRSGDDFAFGMFTPAGVHLSGNVDDMPGFKGWGQIAARGGEPGQANTMLGYAGQIGDHMVVVAHSSGIVWATGNTVLEALVIAGLVIALTSLATGYIVTGWRRRWAAWRAAIAMSGCRSARAMTRSILSRARSMAIWTGWPS